MLDITSLNKWKINVDGYYCTCESEEKTFSNDYLEKVNNKGVWFAHCNFRYIRFKNVVFDDSFIDRCNFVNCIFTNCEFIGAEFRRCKFDKCDFINCNGKITYIRASTFKKNCSFVNSTISLKQIDEYIYINSKRYGWGNINYLCKEEDKE